MAEGFTYAFNCGKGQVNQARGTVHYQSAVRADSHSGP